MNSLNQNRKMLIDRQEIIDAWQVIVGKGNVTEVRALEATAAKENRSWPKVYSGYFNDPEKLVRELETIGAAKGIYLFFNPVDSKLLARSANKLRKAQKGGSTADTNIVRRKWLLVDCDAERPSGISASDAEHDAAVDRAHEIALWLEGQGWPHPIVADSGNGGHLLFRIDEPTNDNGLVSRCLEALHKRFSDESIKVDTSVHSPSQGCKLYGTRACKGDDTPNRPHRMSELLYVPEEITKVSTELLIALAGEADDSDFEKPALHARNGGFHSQHDTLEVQAFIERNELKVRGPERWESGPGTMWTLVESPMCDHHNDGPFIAQFDSGAIVARCHHDSCDWEWRDLRKKLEPQSISTDRRDTVGAPTRVDRLKPFPTDCLPEPVRRFVRIGAKSIGCDPSFIALPLLTAIASAIGNTRRLRLKDGWDVPAILWTAIVGDSGSAKTPAFKLAMRAIEERQRKAFAEFSNEQSQHEAASMVYEKDIAAWKRAKETTEDLPELPEPPQAKRYVLSDTTLEALAPILENNPRGVLVSRDELAGWIGSFGQYKGGRASGDAAQWLSMYNGGSLTVDRKTGDKQTIYVPVAHVSITGGIQPGILERALGIEHRESGMAARFLLAWPPRKVKQWTDEQINPELEKRMVQLIDKLYTLEATEDEYGKSVPVVAKLTDEARRVWIDYYNEHNEEHAELSGDLSAAWSKLEEYAARLAMVFHYVRWAAGDRTLEGPELIDKKSLDAGIRLAQWFKGEAMRVYAMLSESEEERERRALLEWIERSGGVTTHRELQQNHRRIETAAQAKAELDGLVNLNYGYWQDLPTGEKGGRPSREFRLYTVSTSTQPPETADLEGFVDVDGVDDCLAEADDKADPIIGLPGAATEHLPDERSQLF